MPTTTPNTRLDAALRIVEDVIVIALPALVAYLSTHSWADALAAAAATPVVRSGVAAALTKGRVSGLLLAVKLAWQALNAQDQTLTLESVVANPPLPLTSAATGELGDPVYAPDPATDTPAATAAPAPAAP